MHAIERLSLRTSSTKKIDEDDGGEAREHDLQILLADEGGDEFGKVRGHGRGSSGTLGALLIRLNMGVVEGAGKHRRGDVV